MSSISSIFRKRELAILISIVVMVIVFGDYFITGIPGLAQTATELKAWAVIIAAPAMGLGMIQLFRWESARVRRREKEWPFSLFSIVMMFVAFLAGLIPPIGGSPATIWLQLYVVNPMEGVGFSLTALCMATALAAAVRMKSVDSFALTLTTLLILVTNVPIISSLSPQLASLSNWCNNYLNVGVMRASDVVVGISIIGLGVRAVLGREKGYFR